MLDRRSVEAEEERLRQRASALPEAARKGFYDAARQRLKDPDTYATLNWFFMVGLHHFYLGRWGRGALDGLLFAAGVALLFVGRPWLGAALIVAVAVTELWALFRAQLIVQDWNNAIYRQLLAQWEPGTQRHPPQAR